METRLVKIAALAGLLLLAVACTTVQPMPIPPENPSPSVVRDNLDSNLHKPVTWGGIILVTEAKQNVSLVTVLAKPLDSNGEPIDTEQSYGRFIAQFNDFRDPAVFAAGRVLTVVGTIQGSETRKIGDYDYVHPLVSVTDYRLWQVRQNEPYYSPYWYDPWYPYGYPWYPWYPGYYPPIYYPPSPPPARIHK